MLRNNNIRGLLLSTMAVMWAFSACSSTTNDTGFEKSETTGEPQAASVSDSDVSVKSAVDFDHELDPYEPKKKNYNF